MSDNYIKKSNGDTVLKVNIPAVDLLRHELVERLVERGREIAELVEQFKREAYLEIEAFVDVCATEYGIKRGGKKGNITLPNFDASLKVLLSRDEQAQFDERLALGQQLIRECIDELLDGANPELKMIIDNAFQVNKQGQVSVARIMGLRHLKISHPKWNQAMEVLKDSIFAAGRRTYIRLYERKRETDKYTQISLDGSSALNEKSSTEGDTP
jgi:hypothetical protein